MSAEARGRWRARLAGLRLDVTPLRTSRDFRVLFVAGFVFFLGAMVGYVAVPFQLYALTGSNFAVGAYGLVQLVPLVLAGSAILGAAIATLVGWLSIRRQGVYFVMLTLAFSQLFYFMAYTFSGITGGDNGLLGVPRPSLGGAELNAPWSYYTYVAVCFLAIFAILVMVTQSTFGRTLIAIRENEGRAAAIGFPTRLFKIEAFAISGAVTAFGGALHAMLIGVAPLSNIEHHTSELILIMTIIGGSSSLFGSVLGAGFYLLLADALSAIWPRWLLLLGLVLVAVALFLQRGLWGLVERGYDLVARRGKTPAKEH